MGNLFLSFRPVDADLRHRKYFLLFCIYFKGLLKKHEAFEKDFDVHKERVKDIEKESNGLVEEVGCV